ncbi:MAG: nuclear transport factor 2 family protein [Bryobacteraceae bacterium]|jgi:ketosteroid isomerase-like protein
MRNAGISSGVLLTMMAALACAQPQPPAAGRAGASSPADPLREQIVAQERAGLDALKTGDLAAFAASTADEAVFVDAHGPATKAEVIEHTAEFRLHEYTMADVRFVPLSADSGLIVYTLTESGTSHGKEFAARVHVSSVWLKRGGKWQCVFSQETAAR